jgi:hypothetical protein
MEDKDTYHLDSISSHSTSKESCGLGRTLEMYQIREIWGWQPAAFRVRADSQGLFKLFPQPGYSKDHVRPEA